MALFRTGFDKYLESGQFSDLTIVAADGTEYKAHKLIVAVNSDFFKKLLFSEWKESFENRVELGFPDPDGVFPHILRFLYTGCIRIDIDNAIPLLAMADHYSISALKEVATAYINDMINRDNALETLKKCIKYSSLDVQNTCVSVVARNFWRTDERTDFASIPFSIFQQILQHKYLAVKEESLLFKIICKFVEDNKDNLTEQQITALFENVRFRWLSYEELVAAQQNPYVPKNQLSSALLMRLARHENGGSDVAPRMDLTSSAALQPRRTFGVMFDFHEEYEKTQFNGILYHIGTAKGAEEWRNPHLTQRVRVLFSSLDKGEFTKLTALTPSELWTKDVPASWFMIDFGPGRQIIPNYYTLRHGGNYRADSLRNWDFQGSNDAKSWTVLRRHTDDQSLNGPYAMCSWPIEGCTMSFRYFRVLQTGHNSSNHNYLVLSGLEIYGELYEDETVSYDWPKRDNDWWNRD